VAYPSTRLTLSTGPSRTLLEQVRTGRLDCAFLALPPSLRAPDALQALGLMSQPVWREVLVLLLPASESRTRKARDVQVRALAAFPQGCTYRSIAEDILGMDGASDWTVHEMASYHSMVACVAAGACVTLLPKSVLALTSAPDTLKTLSAGRADTVLVWHEGLEAPAFEHLRQLLG